jgi:hypothetical protein
MGATAFTYTSPLRRVSRHLVKRSGTVTLSSTYATGGDDFAPVVGKTCLAMHIEPKGGYVFTFDSINNKVLAYATGALNAASNEVAAAVNLSTIAAIKWQSLGTK